MKTINLSDFKPTITNPQTAELIYNKIKELDPFNCEICIELGEIVTMTTRCAKIIFGSLYVELGADMFYKNLLLNNCSEGLNVIIELGIEHAVSHGTSTR